MDADVAAPRAYLVTLVTRLCINELDSARSGARKAAPIACPSPWRSRRQRHRTRRHARPDLDGVPGAAQRLTPAERAVLLLRDVFDFDYKEIASLVGKTEPACRKLLERAREHVATEKRLFAASPEVHQRLLMAFGTAVRAGDVQALVELLAEDAVMVTDGGPEGRRVGVRRNLPAARGRRADRRIRRRLAAPGQALPTESAS